MSTELITPRQIPYSQSAAANLNLRQKSFVDNLLECKVQWRAAQLAGYTGDEPTLSVTAYDLLRNPKVQAYYQERLELLHMSANEVLAEVGEIARAPWRDFVQVKTDDEGNTISAQVRLGDKLKALELAGKAHGTWIERVEQSGDPALNSSQLAAIFREAMLAARAARAIDVEGGGPTGPTTPNSEGDEG